MRETASYNRFWGTDGSFRHGNGNALVTWLNTTSGVLATGTTLFGLAHGNLHCDSDSYPICVPGHPTDAYNSYAEATGAVLYNNTCFLCISPGAEHETLTALLRHR